MNSNIIQKLENVKIWKKVEKFENLRQALLLVREVGPPGDAYITLMYFQLYTQQHYKSFFDGELVSINIPCLKPLSNDICQLSR